jgi:hypothetical protein
MVALLSSPASLLTAASAWEAAAADATGLSAAYLRYVFSFFLSVLVGWGWRYVPTARGKQTTRKRERMRPRVLDPRRFLDHARYKGSCLR